MGKVIIHKDDITVEEKELNLLREGIEREYRKREGVHADLTKSTPSVWTDMADSFKVKFAKKSFRIYFKDAPDSEESSVDTPGWVFLRKLFRVKKYAKSMTSRRFNIELCYQYAFDKTRSEYLSPQIGPPPQKARIRNSEKTRAIISSTQKNIPIAENLQNHLLITFNMNAEIHIRDISFLSKQPLVDFYQNGLLNKQTLLIFLILGTGCFQHGTSFKELIEIKKRFINRFLNHTIIIGLDDICDGEGNIQFDSGKFKIIEFWNQQIKSIEGTIIAEPLIRHKKTKKSKAFSQGQLAVKQANAIVAEVVPFIDTILSHKATFTPYNIFKTHFKKEQLKQFLQKQNIKR